MITNNETDLPLRQDIERYARPSHIDLESTLRAVRADDAARASPHRRLARLNTRERRGVALAIICAVGLPVVWHMGLRHDIAEHWLRLSVIFTVLIGSTAALLRLSLRDIAAPPPGRRAWSIGAAGLALLLSAPWIGHWLPGRPLMLGAFWTLRCFRFTLLIGGVAMVTLLLLQRPGLSAPWRALSAGLVGALAAAFFLMLHCDINDAMHQWSGHTMPGLVVVTLALLGGAWLRRRRTRQRLGRRAAHPVTGVSNDPSDSA